MLKVPATCVPFWSHGGTRTAGVGLWVQRRFLDNFNSISPEDWHEVVPGRVGILRLDGALGSLDLVVLYMPTGAAQEERARIRRAIRHGLRPREAALTLMFGDWNYVSENADRFGHEGARWAGMHDLPEQRQFEQEFGDGRGFTELEQEAYTHQSAIGRSRLDRVYSNHFLCDQLDRDWGCVALPWAPTLSAHRPIAFFRRCRPQHALPTKPLRTDILRDPEWPRRTVMAYTDATALEASPPDALRKLVLLKESMVQVADRMTEEKRDCPTPTAPDRLGTTMQLIRAAEKVRLGVMRRCAAEYPHLRTFIDPNDPEARSRPGMTQLRQHAVELGRQALLDDLRGFQEARSNMDPMQAQAVKDNLHSRLRRFAPGASSVLRAVQLSDGSVTTRPAEIAQALATHWSQVFGTRPLDRVALERWLEQSLPPDAPRPQQDPRAWAVRRRDVSRALRTSGNSMAGPDRIPYEAWRRLGALGVDILFGTARAMASPTFSADIRRAYGLAAHEPHPFNLGTLVCLPKKPVGVHPQHGEIYTAEATRPLCIVDTANRLIANAYRFRWEPLLDPCVHAAQHGFLPGRSLLSNVVDVEEAAASFALQEQHAAIFLFDFSAAFLSVNQEFLIQSLVQLGIPAAAVCVVQALYDCCRCVLSFGGQVWDGFRLSAGIRQGCPLSPLLFATVLDPFLRTLQRRLPRVVVRAYADDIAVVLPDLFSDLAGLRALYEELAAASHLALNLPKCVCLPLWEAPLQEVSDRVAASCPAWAGMEFSRVGKYLGFFVGPEKGWKSWEAAGAKMLRRARAWPWNALGLFYAAVAYNTYVASLPAFVAQLEPYPSDFAELEAKVLRLAAPGPYAWASPADLCRLRDHYGQAGQFQSLSIVAQAAKLRVAHFEADRTGGLQLKPRADRLRALLRSTDHAVRRAHWRHWFDSNPLLVLAEAAADSRARGVSHTAIVATLSGGEPRPWPRAVWDKVSHGYQAAASQYLRQVGDYNEHERMRNKLTRWRLSGFPRRNALSALRRLDRLKSITAPRVRAAALSTLWNRWATARRFQTSRPCVLRCSQTAQDCIEHYACCPVVRDVAAAHLRLRLRSHPEALADFLLIDLPPDPAPEENVLCRMALLVAAVYAATNSARHNPPAHVDEARAMVQQAIGNAAAGHRHTERVLSQVWTDIPHVRSRRRQ